MSTTKPRITVTLEPHAYEVISRLSAVGGDSMSALVAQFVNVSLPSLERLVVVLERAKAAPEETRLGLVAAVERAERTLLPALTGAQDTLDLFIGDLESAPPGGAPPAPAQRGRVVAPAGVAGVRDPRLVTRGSGTSKGRGKGVQRG